MKKKRARHQKRRSRQRIGTAKELKKQRDKYKRQHVMEDAKQDSENDSTTNLENSVKCPEGSSNQRLHEFDTLAPSTSEKELQDQVEQDIAHEINLDNMSKFKSFRHRESNEKLCCSEKRCSHNFFIDIF